MTRPPKAHVCPKCNQILGYEIGGYFLTATVPQIVTSLIFIDVCFVCGQFFEKSWRFVKEDTPAENVIK